MQHLSQKICNNHHNTDRRCKYRNRLRTFEEVAVFLALNNDVVRRLEEDKRPLSEITMDGLFLTLFYRRFPAIRVSFDPFRLWLQN